MNEMICYNAICSETFVIRLDFRLRHLCRKRLLDKKDNLFVSILSFIKSTINAPDFKVWLSK